MVSIFPAPLTLPAEIEVLVLDEFIHPRAAPEQSARKVSAKAGLRIQANPAQAVFARHGLKKRRSRRHVLTELTERLRQKTRARRYSRSRW